MASARNNPDKSTPCLFLAFVFRPFTLERKRLLNHLPERILNIHVNHLLVFTSGRVVKPECFTRPGEAGT